MVFARRAFLPISPAQVQVVSELLSLGTALCCTTLCLAHGLKFSQTGLLMAHAFPKRTVNSFVTKRRKPPKADTSMSRRSATLELSLPRFGKPRDSLPRPKRRKHPLKLLHAKEHKLIYVYQHLLALKNHSFEQRLSLSGAYVFCTSKAHFGHLGGPHFLWIQAVKLVFPPKMYLHDVNPSEIKQPKVFQSVLTQLTWFKRRSAPATWSPVLGGVQWPEGRPSTHFQSIPVMKIAEKLRMLRKKQKMN